MSLDELESAFVEAKSKGASNPAALSKAFRSKVEEHGTVSGGIQWVSGCGRPHRSGADCGAAHALARGREGSGRNAPRAPHPRSMPRARASP